MIVVGYCRYSSEGQRDGYSIEAQSTAIKDYCSTNGHELYKLYIDEALSATDDDREEFLNMIADSKSGLFEAIVVHKLDRFARNRYDSAIYGKILEDRNITLYSITEPIISEDSPEAGLFRGVIETINEYYSKNLGRECLKGKRIAAQECKHLGGPVPYGFMLDKNNRYTPHPEEAPIVFEAFSKLDSGKTPSDVARWLSAKGVLTRYNLLYTPSAVVRMTENPVYMGRYTWGARSTKKKFIPIVVDNAFPAIVSPELFQRVNAATMGRKKGPLKRLKEVDYLLTGFLFCEHCGAHLYGFKSRSVHTRKDGSINEYVAYKYRCSNAKRTANNRRFDKEFDFTRCELQMFKKEDLEHFVLASIKQTLFSEDALSFILEALRKKALSRIPGSPEDIKKIETQIKSVSTKLQRLLDVYLEGSIDRPSYTAKYKELDSQLTMLNTELSKMSTKPPEVSLDRIKSAISAFNVDTKNDTEEYAKILLVTYVDHIDISNEHIIIYYKFNMPGLPSSSTYNFVRKTTSVSI